MHERQKSGADRGNLKETGGGVLTNAAGAPNNVGTDSKNKKTLSTA